MNDDILAKPSVELLACPFCSGEANWHPIAVQCKDCGAQIISGERKHVALWNTRSNPLEQIKDQA